MAGGLPGSGRAERAARDAALLALLTTRQPDVVVETQPGFWRVSLYARGRPVSLTEVLPGLQSLGLDVLDEQPFAVTRPDGARCWIYDFRVRPPENAGAQAADVRQRVQDALSAIWEGCAETDRFNGLVVSSGLTWQEAALLRAYYGYLRQAGFPLGRAYVASVLMDHPGVVQILMGLFTARFDPASDRASSAARAADLGADAAARIDDVESLDANRVLRAYLTLVLGTVRTNYYRDSPAGDSVASALALKLHPEEPAELPMPRPRIEVFVAGPRVEGVHIRFGAVARGGLRWSDEANRVTVSATVSCGRSVPSCSCTPTRSRRAARSRCGSRPRTLMVPPSGLRSPEMHSTVVVFPAPFGPRMPKILPSSTWRDTSLTATVEPYDLRRPETSMTGYASDREATCLLSGA